MKRLFIDHIPGETRLALVENDHLRRLHLYRPDSDKNREAISGDICLGRVVKVVPSLQAAFVDIGAGENGFLPVSATAKEDISKAVHEGEKLLVQVRREANGGKGALLSAKIDLVAPDCLLTPGRPGLNISRKFTREEDRHFFQTSLEPLELPQNCGLIVRTSAQDQSPDILHTQAEQLIKRWQLIEKQAKKGETGLIERSADALETLIKNCLTDQPEEIWVQGIDAFHHVQKQAPQAQLYQGMTSLFEAEGIDALIEQLCQPSVPLDGGGTLDIEPTKALVAVDVNMGNRTDSRNLTDNQWRTNKQAIVQLKQQIILRNLSGQIIVDFIFMKNKNKQHEMLEFARQTLSDERLTVHGFTRLGLLEITRTRRGPSLMEEVENPYTLLFALMRKLAYTTVSPRTRVGLGCRLFSLNAQPPFKALQRWLKERLGFMPDLYEDINLPPLNYHLEEMDHE